MVVGHARVLLARLVRQHVDGLDVDGHANEHGEEAEHNDGRHRGRLCRPCLLGGLLSLVEGGDASHGVGCKGGGGGARSGGPVCELVRIPSPPSRYPNPATSDVGMRGAQQKADARSIVQSVNGKPCHAAVTVQTQAGDRGRRLQGCPPRLRILGGEEAKETDDAKEERECAHAPNHCPGPAQNTDVALLPRLSSKLVSLQCREQLLCVLLSHAQPSGQRFSVGQAECPQERRDVQISAVRSARRVEAERPGSVGEEELNARRGLL